MTDHDPDPEPDAAIAALDLDLEEEAARLLSFGRHAAHPDGGFGWLDEDGRLDPARPVETWITSRMTHCFAIARLRGDDSVGDLVDRGVDALTGRLRDAEHGGWHSAVEGDGPVTDVKEAYAHAFVVLAAVSAYVAGHPDAARLLEDALGVLDDRFWQEGDGMVVDVWNRDWTALDPYRGVNANMHTVEALLAAYDVTGERLWLDRATRIVGRVVGVARSHDWRLPEHFDEHWRPQLDYNIDEPGHRFRPYGVTIGHLVEWARLALHLRTALGASAPEWLAGAAEKLYGAAVRRGWAVNGADGFVYTTDFSDQPVVRERMHWVVAEAIAAAWTLHRDLGGAAYLEQFERWWHYADTYLLDRDRGSWHHELSPTNQPSATVWQGKPDIYHAYQATILPLLRPAASFAGAVSVAAG